MFEAQNRVYGRLFLLPAVLAVLLLTIFPLLYSLGMTFTDMRLAQRGVQFIGFANWTRLFADQRFWATLTNTAVFAVIAVTLQYAIGLYLATLLNQQFRGRRFFRLSFLLPMMMSPVAVGFTIGKLILSESIGPFAKLASTLGLDPLSWSRSAAGSMAVLIAVDTWQWVPLFILVLLAGLQAISPEVHEAASVDGATRWQSFWRITFPLLGPLSAIVILIRSLEAFKLLDIVRVITGGAPGYSTESLTAYIFFTGSENGDIAYATTMAFVLLITVILFATAFLLVSSRLTRWRDG